MRKLVILALVFIFVSGCVSQSEKKTESPPEFTPASVEYSCNDCNVIIIAFDALQASHVSSYGYPIETTPNLDNFSKDAILFEDAISPASWTIPTYISWFTSLYPSEHKVVNKFSVYDPPTIVIANLRNLTPSAATLAEVMKQNGYATVGFTGDGGARGAQGGSVGFDIYVDTPAGFNGFDYSIPLALGWIKNNTDKKFFMFLHGYDSHGQYNPKNFTRRFVNFNYSGKFNGTVQEQARLREEGLAYGSVNLSEEDVRFWRAWYDEKINNADARFGAFIESLREMGLLNKTIIIVAADHGTEVYEHGRFDHGHTLYQELIHVPLVIWAPGFKGTKVVTGQVSTLDITPTIFQLVSIAPNEAVKNQIRGISLLPAMKGEGASRDVYSETDYRLYTHKRAIISADGWKLILTLAESGNKSGVKELYNLTTDPRETNNLADSEQRVAYELEQKLVRHLKDMGTRADGPWEIGCSPVYGDQCK